MYKFSYFNLLWTEFENLFYSPLESIITLDLDSGLSTDWIRKWYSPLESMFDLDSGLYTVWLDPKPI